MFLALSYYLVSAGPPVWVRIRLLLEIPVYKKDSKRIPGNAWY